MPPARAAMSSGVIVIIHIFYTSSSLSSGGTMQTLNVQPPSIDWLIYRNDTTTLTVVLTNEDGSPVDVSGWDFRAEVREYPTDVEPITEMDIFQNQNTLTLVLENADLPLISYFDIQGLNSEPPTRISTVLRGQIIVQEDVTKWL